MSTRLLKWPQPIPYGKQTITQEDIDAVSEVLRSDFLTQGPKVNEFEDRFAEYTGAKFAVAVSNGTAALHLAALALGVVKGSKVIVTPTTFVASSNCIAYCGGEVDFADISASTYLIDIDKVREKLRRNPAGTYQGVIPVNYAGLCVNLEAFRALADEFGLWIIEDACHSPGGFFVDSTGKKQVCGNGVFADMSVFSFHPVKHLTSGEGGMITTNSDVLYQKLLLLRSHGITRETASFVVPASLLSGKSSNSRDQTYPRWYMEMQALGYNYRLTDIQAALGISQLRRADGGLQRRRELALKYDEAFKDQSNIRALGLELAGKTSGHAYHLYVLEVEQRDELYEHLRALNIYCQVHYIPTHLMPYYKAMGWRSGDMPNAEYFFARCLSIPMYPALSGAEQSHIISSILAFYAR